MTGCVRPLDYITPLHAADHPDEEARAVVEGEVDVEDVLGCDSTRRLDEGGGPEPLVGDDGCFRQTFRGRR